MFPNQYLVKAILEKLLEKYPKHYDYDRDLFNELSADYDNQDEIKKHLAYLEEEIKITFKEVEAKDSHSYWNIKITSQGIQFLNNL